MDSRFDAAVAPMTNPTGVELRALDVASLSGAQMKGFALLHLMEVMDRESLAAWRPPAPTRGRKAKS